jgi:hypothetical protein
LERGFPFLAGIAIVLISGIVAAGSPEVVVEFPRTAGTVGDRFPMILSVSGTDSAGWEPLPLQTPIGPFYVLDGTWRHVVSDEADEAWVWNGDVAAYEPGELELPAVTVRFKLNDELLEATTEPITVTIESVLGEDDEGGELADLKGPVTVDPEYGALFLALSLLAGILALSAALWWLQRRLAGRLSAVPQPADPFQRMAPHEWAYQALQELLGNDQADPEHAGPFFEEIARILKLYLGGRFRIELMECTTAEMEPLLQQTGAGEKSCRQAERILSRCDMVTT